MLVTETDLRLKAYQKAARNITLHKHPNTHTHTQTNNQTQAHKDTHTHTSAQLGPSDAVLVTETGLRLKAYQRAARNITLQNLTAAGGDDAEAVDQEVVKKGELDQFEAEQAKKDVCNSVPSRSAWIEFWLGRVWVWVGEGRRGGGGGGGGGGCVCVCVCVCGGSMCYVWARVLRVCSLVQPITFPHWMPASAQHQCHAGRPASHSRFCNCTKTHTRRSCLSRTRS